MVKIKNEVLEQEVKKIMAYTNKGHDRWTFRQDYCYYDENTLVVVFTQVFCNGMYEKKYSLMVLMTPAGKETVYNELFYIEDHIEDFDLFINRILNINIKDNQLLITVKMVSGKEKIITV